ncbi:hypothetical protein XYCOK13_07960 [Xylanibacillus composti]|uniref:Uncharacterized protein n=1 Tax=Xylanibacillus composti TaxID=1572762 RepID=A0A8J4M1L3_9BACL|nr:hypothetical protein XYCOK13_07960 [Xylanibacillus composti]
MITIKKVFRARPKSGFDGWLQDVYNRIERVRDRDENGVVSMACSVDTIRRLHV